MNMLWELFLVLWADWEYLLIILLVVQIMRLQERPGKVILAFGIVATAIVLGWTSYWHLQGVKAVADLRDKFEVGAMAEDEGTAFDPRPLLQERDQRLDKLGLRIDGVWWYSKATGEPTQVTTWPVYRWTGNTAY
jgi:hypothetical protein